MKIACPSSLQPTALKRSSALECEGSGKTAIGRRGLFDGGQRHAVFLALGSISLVPVKPGDLHEASRSILSMYVYAAICQSIRRQLADAANT
jgi:hypothetical protein